MPEIRVAIPLLNPNEPDALLRTLYVHEGQWITKGEPLATLETTKSTADLEASIDGFVVGLRFQAGQMAPTGETLCYLAESPDWKAPQSISAQTPSQEGIPEGLRISEPALKLAHQHALDLQLLPIGPLVTESMVRAALQKTSVKAPAPSTGEFDPTAILVYGGGGHGKALIDLVRRLGSYQVVGVIDDGLKAGTEIMDVPVLGGAEALSAHFAQGVRLAVNAVGGIGNLNVRLKVFERLADAGFTCPGLVHPLAFVEDSAQLSPGVQVMPHAYVGSEARVGFGVIVNTGAIVSHDCILEDYVNVSPGAILAGEVHLGRGVLIGMGVTVNLRATIGTATRIGNGATIKSDVPGNSVVKAGTTWPE